MDQDPATPPSGFERQMREAEVDLRRQEVKIKADEQRRLADEAARSRWWNPLFIAIVGATIAAVGNIGVSWWNAKASQETEALKAESARILEAIKVDPDKAKENLRFLLAAGLISNPLSDNIKKYIDTQPPGKGPSLSWPQPAVPGAEPAILSLFSCPGADNGRQYWIYHYTERQRGDPTFRVILPPNWGQPIGGHDLTTREEAEKVALQACR